MNKIISVILVTLLAISCLAACGRKAPVDQPANTLKFGMGTSSAYGKMADADGDTNGSSTISTTVAAVLLDADGKIVKCAVDAIDGKVEYTSNGELVAVNAEIRNHPIEVVGRKLRAYMTAMKPLID